MGYPKKEFENMFALKGKEMQTFYKLVDKM
jgi:hypothetical protein